MIAVPAFAEPDDCRSVIDAYERCRSTRSRALGGDGFFDFRVLWIHSFPKRENPARRILQGWRRRAVAVVSEIARERLYSDSVQVVRWDGQEMPPHQDDRHPDGSEHGTPWRAWSSVIYLNDDFDGGDIYFPETGEAYRPVTGSLVVFRGSDWHGVRGITSGSPRYTSPGWYTPDPAHEDRHAAIDY